MYAVWEKKNSNVGRRKKNEMYNIKPGRTVSIYLRAFASHQLRLSFTADIKSLKKQHPTVNGQLIDK